MLIAMKPLMMTTKKISEAILLKLLPTALLLLSGACSIKPYYPAPGTPSEDRFAILKNDSLLVAVRPQAYPGSFPELNNRFFPVLIKIKNTTTHQVQIPKDTFGIIAAGRQFDPIPIDVILDMMQQSILLNWPDYNFNMMDTNDFLPETDNLTNQYYELLSDAFSYGELLPGGTKEGYLFYDNQIETCDSLTIDILGTPLGFIR